MIDKELFLRDTMPSIFRSKDIETLLINSFHALKKHLPVDMVDFSYYIKETHSILRLCTYEDGKINQNRFLKLPEQNRTERYPMGDVYLLTDLYDMHSDGPRVCPTENNSTIIMRCRDIGAWFNIKARGEGAYNEEHKSLIRELVTPYNTALYYAVRQMNMISEKAASVSSDKTYASLSRTAVNDIIGSDGGLLEVMEQASRVALYPSSVLLTGETGTGKEILANYIHSASERRDGAFIKINCGAIPETLIETELFGYEKGAFTGADSQKKGCFELADRGTLFLDEVGELSLSAQTKLLRALQFGEFSRVGGGKSVQVNVRIIAATNRNLADMVDKELFRKDLYFRLNVFPINIPPIRDRREDIPPLVNHMIAKKCGIFGIKNIPTVSAHVMKKLINYDWPGNIREIENIVERELITNHRRELSFESILLGNKDYAEMRCSTAESNLLLDDAMKNHIIKILEQTKWRISGKNGAADMLGINASTLRHRMRRLGLL